MLLDSGPLCCATPGTASRLLLQGALTSTRPKQHSPRCGSRGEHGPARRVGIPAADSIHTWDSVLPRTAIRHDGNAATGRCLLAVPSNEAYELSRSWRSSAQAPKPTVGAGGSVVVGQAPLAPGWANSLPSRIRSPVRHTRGIARTSTHTGRDTRATAQSSRRWLAREHTRAPTRYTGGPLAGQGRKGHWHRGLTSNGPRPNRIDTESHRIKPPYLPYRIDIYDTPPNVASCLRPRCQQADNQENRKILPRYAPILARYPFSLLMSQLTPVYTTTTPLPE